MNRRDFLRSSTCVGALAAVPLALRPRAPIIRDGEVFTWTDKRPLPKGSRITNCVVDVHETIELSDRCVIQGCRLNLYGDTFIFVPINSIRDYSLVGNYIDTRRSSCAGTQNTVPCTMWAKTSLRGRNVFGGMLDEVAWFDVEV
jgi:hypothetical protein